MEQILSWCIFDTTLVQIVMTPDQGKIIRVIETDGGEPPPIERRRAAVESGDG